VEYWSVGVLEYWVVKAEKNYFVTPLNPLFQHSITPIAQLGRSPKFFISLP
jgi:hypothetical protein